MHRPRLSNREGQICGRIREIREWLGFTQNDCARRIGIERSALVKYGIGRTPLRYDIALRFCRQLILSEEWLATGRFDACHAAAVRHGFRGIQLGCGGQGDIHPAMCGFAFGASSFTFPLDTLQRGIR